MAGEEIAQGRDFLLSCLGGKMKDCQTPLFLAVKVSFRCTQRSNNTGLQSCLLAQSPLPKWLGNQAFRFKFYLLGVK